MLNQILFYKKKLHNLKQAFMLLYKLFIKHTVRGISSDLRYKNVNDRLTTVFI